MRIFFEWLGLIISTLIIVGLTFILSWLFGGEPWHFINAGIAFVLCGIGAYFRLHRKVWGAIGDMLSGF